METLDPPYLIPVVIQFLLGPGVVFIAAQQPHIICHSGFGLKVQDNYKYNYVAKYVKLGQAL